MRCVSVFVNSVPRLVVLNATVKIAMSRAKTNLSYADDVCMAQFRLHHCDDIS